MKEKTIKDLTSLLKWKEGIINTIAITNIVCVTDLSILIIINNYLVIKEELLSVSVERQKELETLQEVITSLMLQLRERDKQFEILRQNLKGNWY